MRNVWKWKNLRNNTCICKDEKLVRKEVDVNKHDRLSNLTIRHTLK